MLKDVWGNSSTLELQTHPNALRHWLHLLHVHALHSTDVDHATCLQRHNLVTTWSQVANTHCLDLPGSSQSHQGKSIPSDRSILRLELCLDFRNLPKAHLDGKGQGEAFRFPARHFYDLACFPSLAGAGFRICSHPPAPRYPQGPPISMSFHVHIP